MGIEAQAFLVYGIDLGDRIPKKFHPDAEGAVDFDEVICAAAGLVEPGYNSPEYTAYRAKREALLDNCPVDLCVYGRDFDVRYVLFVRGHSVSAHNVTPTRLSLADLGISEARIASVQQFCQDYGVNWSNPGWLLIARRC